MKRVIIFTLVLIVFAVPAFADFIEDFNRYADIHGIEQAKLFSSADGSTYYKSGVTLLSADDRLVTIGGHDHIKTLAVACCALDSINKKESYTESSGRIFIAYLDALKTETGKAYSAPYGYIEIHVTIAEDSIIINLVK